MNIINQIWVERHLENKSTMKALAEMTLEQHSGKINEYTLILEMYNNYRHMVSDIVKTIFNNHLFYHRFEIFATIALHEMAREGYIISKHDGVMFWYALKEW